ncbi:MAG: PLP-dependent aminotransferase family protein [Methylotenera sp.]|nr:PLP-dependent aminotransferase family protein [Methylotenera sp.]MDP1754702.1 PLP-dependent aminotransferase family protein [Methylotenera sp.]MDP1958740.1 PLP-dependent aminotransferase family protein [Methylotenera sp.]MDP3207203.1 PLP-dependent aminotransferase family protein [Methylotenera sp.]MDP3303652.1 PLP-dependent aminotransferase family protein [Methylotenera sp.]
MLRSWSLNLNIKNTSGLAVYLQIAQQVVDEIQRGRLAPSTAMPGTRDLAEKLKVNRKTVVLAYDELIAQGWLTTESRRGTFVSANLPSFSAQATPTKLSTKRHPAQLINTIQTASSYHPPTPNTIEFNDGIPDTRLIPFDILSRAFRHVLLATSKNSHLGYGDPKGVHELRLAIATMLNMERGLNVDVDHICIARGSQMGIFLAARALTQANDYVVVESLSYPPAREAFRSCGAKILTVGLDDYGIDINALEKLCKKHAIRAIYVTPHHQFPTTVMMTAERRLKLLMLAEQYDFVIVEDDYDHEFHFSHHPVFPLASTDHHGRVIYVGSLSKVLAPGLRVGYLVASKEFIQQCANEVMLIDRQGNSITEQAVAELMASGEIKRHIRRTFKIYNERRNILIELIRKELSEFVSFDEPNGGLAIWLRLNDGINIEKLVKNSLHEQVRVLPASLFSESPLNINAIRLGFGSLNPAELTEGIQRIKRAFMA